MDWSATCHCSFKYTNPIFCSQAMICGVLLKIIFLLNVLYSKEIPLTLELGEVKNWTII